MDELPHRAVVNLQPAFGEFGNQPAQGEIAHLDPFQHPDTVFARNRFRSVPAHFARRDAAGLSLPSYPSNGRANGNPELLAGLVARQPPGHNRRNDALPKIQRVRLAHPCWPPAQPAW
jgi:hypothetical protein